MISKSLHSHDIHYGSGSRQQSVTAINEFSDWGSLWQLKEAHGVPPKYASDPLKCGDDVRLEHVNTEKNLHSHNINSWITKGGTEEVSAYGRGGNGDISDNWIVECESKNIGEVIYG